MLTESEKEWLEDRAEHDDNKFCRWCKYNEVKGREKYGVYCFCVYDEYTEFNTCVTKNYYLEPILEAAEFEARVAAELTRIPRHYPEGPCDYGNARMCTIECALPWLDCRDARLKWARLKVEEDFDGEVVK